MHMKALFFLFISLSFASMTQLQKSKVIFFGDSITQAGMEKGGYITIIDSLCKSEDRGSEFEFVGAGISGNKV